VLIDRLLNTDDIISKDDDWALQDAICFNIDNIADFVNEKLLNEKFKNIKIPNAAPPFENMWFEYKNIPELFGIDQIRKVGVQITTVSREAPNYEGFRTGLLKHSHHVDSSVMLEKILSESPRWITVSRVCLDYITGNMFFASAVVISGVLDDGTIIPDKNGDPGFSAVLYNPRNQILTKDVIQEVEYFSEIMETIMTIPYLGISFLHCKNVVTQDHSPDSKLQKSRIKRNKLPMVIYKTLVIHPMTTILEREGHLSGTGIQKALHICRGHFKDFSQGKGLFGKFKGMYWWEPQARGSSTAGILVKDYKIDTTKK
jgi:hypothetical protein